VKVDVEKKERKKGELAKCDRVVNWKDERGNHEINAFSPPKATKGICIEVLLLGQIYCVSTRE
jgi:hypothetical protein